MAASNNKHALEVKEYYNSANDPNPWRESVEVWVTIQFDNGDRTDVLFSQGGLAGCRADN